MHWTAGFRLCHVADVTGPPPVISIVKPMKILSRLFVAVVAAWVLGSLFAAAFLGRASGGHTWGGYPATKIEELRGFLKSQGFVQEVTVGGANQPERFSGTYRGSALFFVTVSTVGTNAYSVYVVTSWNFRGFNWKVDKSSTEASNFADVLDRWLTDQRMRTINAKSQA